MKEKVRELQYLYYIGPITARPDTVVGTLAHAIGLKVLATPLAQLVDEAVKVALGTWMCRRAGPAIRVKLESALTGFLAGGYPAGPVSDLRVMW